jgi:hypothetical protein
MVIEVTRLGGFMIRGIILSLLLFGCTLTDDVGLTHRSTVATRTQGFGLNYSGEFAQIGMMDNTCRVQTQTGFIGADYDVVSGEEDKVEDIYGPSVLVVGASGNNAYILNATNLSNSIIYSGPVDQAKFIDNGAVILSDCNVNWLSEDSIFSAAVPCGGQLSVNPIDGTVYLGTTENIVVVTPDGLQTTDSSGSLVAFDSSLNILYSGRVGDSFVTGLQDGVQIWSTDLGQPVSSLDDMGERGMVAVMIGGSAGGAVITLDGLTGEVKSNFVTPTTADSIKVSGNGAVIAIGLPNEVHFYDVK